jgi:AraC-like DNA-binding protein
LTHEKAPAQVYIRRRGRRTAELDHGNADERKVDLNRFSYTEAFPAGGSTTIDPNTVYLHDSSYVSAVYRANMTSGSGSGCTWYDYLGVARAGSGPSGTVVMTPDPLRAHTVPSTITAKLFLRLMRFRALLAASSSASQHWADLATRCGYSDQSHMIADFRTFSGSTPANLARSNTFHPFRWSL